MLTWYELHGEPDGEEGAKTELETALASVAESYRPFPIETPNRVLTNHDIKYNYPALVDDAPFPIIRKELDQPIKWKERFRTPSRPTRRSIDYYITLFLEGKLAQVKGGKRKAGTYGDLSERFKWFRKFTESMTLDDLNESLLTRWYNHVIQESGSGYRQRNLFRACTMLAKWCFEEGYSDRLPRNITKRWEFLEHVENGERIDQLAGKLFTKEDFDMMLTKLPPQGRACVLLGLNCGFTAADCAALKKSQVNLTEGRIVYSRIKTVRVKHAPVVNYRLWACTVEALRATESKSDTLWFLTKQGQPLKTSTVVDGRHKLWSVLSRQWQRWVDQEKVPKGKPHKFLRKTGATTMGDSIHRPWRALYLGDVPDDIAGKFYDLKSGKVIPELDKAIEYVGLQFGLK